MKIHSNLKKREKLSNIMEERIRSIEFEMKKILLEENPFLLPDRWYKDDPIIHYLWSGGKRLRPILCLFACEAVGGDWRKSLPTAAGIEFLHTFTLIHDDIMDKSEIRRGKPSLHSVWGEPIAITAGDTLYSLAFKAFLKNAEIEGVTHEQVNRVIDIAVKKCISLAKGQTMDIMFERIEKISTEEYMEMARMKTSSMIELALVAGAIIGNGEDNEIASLESIGRDVGLAFQIQDDILDIEGIETGKPKALDLERRKKTLIVIHSLENANERDREKLASFMRGEDMPVDDIVEVLKRTGSIEFARRKVRELLDRARREIESLEENIGRYYLEKTIEYIMNRKK